MLLAPINPQASRFACGRRATDRGKALGLCAGLKQARALHRLGTHTRAFGQRNAAYGTRGDL